MPLVGLGLAGLMLWCWLRQGHSGTFSDADLLPVRQELTGNANGWNTLLSAADNLRWSPELSKRSGHFAAPETWDSSRVAAFLDENQETLHQFESALAYDRFQVPPPQSAVEDYEYLSNWRCLATVALIRAEDQFRRGEEAEGFRAALEVVRFGHRLQESDGTLIHYWIATSIRHQALDRIRWMTARTTLPPETLIEFVRALEPYASSTSGLVNALKTEYKLAKEFLAEMAQGRIPTETNSPLDQVAFRFGSRLFLNVERSRDRLAELCRTSLADLERPYAAGAATRVKQDEGERSRLELMLSGNAVGELMLDLLAHPWERAAAVKCRDNVRHRSTMSILALKAFHARNGHLPRHLDLLVPEFLPAVPIDDFDGQPLRYRPEDRLLYSVGADLTDPLERDGDAPRSRSDLVFRIEFN
ncbi:MAG: hypothetical protein KJ072_26455 [Verrucomicrobia bacterium]|nr:hypothetical protein [Verrucomicrobiota bacterium]